MTKPISPSRGGIAGMLLLQWCWRDRNIPALIIKTPRWLLTIIWVVLALLVVLSAQNSNSFIYFQF